MSGEQRYRLVVRQKIAGEDREMRSYFTYPWAALLEMIRRAREAGDAEPRRVVRVERAEPGSTGR